MVGVKKQLQVTNVKLQILDYNNSFVISECFCRGEPSGSSNHKSYEYFIGI